MNKKRRNSFWMMAIASTCLAMSTASCSLGLDEEPEKPFTTCPVEVSKFYACGINQNGEKTLDIVFTDDDIEWFDVNTRELKFKDLDEPLYEKFKLLSGVEFYVGDRTLFSGITLVSLICSQFFDDLVLCCGKIDGGVVDTDGYYLYDCYPPQFIDDERVKTNRMRRAEDWEVFTKFLDSKGKLKK